MSRLSLECGGPHGNGDQDTTPRKISVLPNVFAQDVISSGLPAVPARNASTAAQGVAARESVQTAYTCALSATAVMQSPRNWAPRLLVLEPSGSDVAVLIFSGLLKLA